MSKPKQPKRPRVVVPPTEIDGHLQRQLRLLEKSCASFDAGDMDEYGRIATSIRIITYDHGQSRSLLEQLGMKNISFRSYARPIDGRNLLSNSPLVMIRMGPGSTSTTLPILDNGGYPVRSLSFDDWWDEHVFRLPDDQRLTRGEVVLIAANQDGGAHVDPELDQVFHRIARANEAGFVATGPAGDTELGDLEKTSVRHIAFELLASVDAELTRRAGNNGCHCGSGQKFRYCHGKPRHSSAHSSSTP